MVARCGLVKEKTDAGATRGLIPTHVQEATRTNTASQVYFFISRTNILALTLFVFEFFGVVTKYVTVLVLQASIFNLKLGLRV